MAQRVEQQDGSGRPRVWLVLGEKPGDNAQIKNLAAAVGWVCEEKKIVVQPEWLIRKPRVRPTLEHVDLARSDSLAGPWPDLVITAGRRLSCVGMWIKRASEGRTRLVMIGRPRRLFGAVDLIVIAKHYLIKPGPNVANHELPLMHVDPHSLEKAKTLWRSRIGELARPVTALMVGGPTGGLRFDLEVARDLFDKTLGSVKASGGSLYITTSRRTPPAVVEMLRDEIPDFAQLYEFDRAAAPSQNPYLALLGLADRFIVTTDSASMMVEVARLGRPLALYPLENRLGPLEHVLTSLGLVQAFSPRSDPNPAGGFWARTAYRLGRPMHSRDLSAIPQLLVEKGMASWLGDEWRSPAPFVDDELERMALRIRGLVEPRSGGRD